MKQGQICPNCKEATLIRVTETVEQDSPFGLFSGSVFMCPDGTQNNGTYMRDVLKCTKCTYVYAF